MTFLIFICLAAFLGLLRLLRRDRVSLGLPVAYLYSLLLIHVPGAFAHIAKPKAEPATLFRPLSRRGCA